MEKIIYSGRLCRHEKHGRCSYEYWRIMRRSGKPGLEDYTCLLWRDKKNVQPPYPYPQVQVAGRKPDLKNHLMDHSGGVPRVTDHPVACRDYRFDPDNAPIHCRFYFLEICLLKFPLCPGRCDDFLPKADQRR